VKNIEVSDIVTGIGTGIVKINPKEYVLKTKLLTDSDVPEFEKSLELYNDNESIYYHCEIPDKYLGRSFRKEDKKILIVSQNGLQTIEAQQGKKMINISFIYGINSKLEPVAEYVYDILKIIDFSELSFEDLIDFINLIDFKNFTKLKICIETFTKIPNQSQAVFRNGKLVSFDTQKGTEIISLSNNVASYKDENLYYSYPLSQQDEESNMFDIQKQILVKTSKMRSSA